MVNYCQRGGKVQKYRQMVSTVGNYVHMTATRLLAIMNGTELRSLQIYKRRLVA